MIPYNSYLFTDTSIYRIAPIDNFVPALILTYQVDKNYCFALLLLEEPNNA